MRVCQVSAAYYPYPSGVSEIAHHLTLALRERGHKVHILTTNYGPKMPAQPGVTRIGRARLIPMNRAKTTVPFGRHMSGEVKRFLHAGRFDILHLHGAFPPDISFWALRHSPTVTIVNLHTVGFITSRLAASLMSGFMARYNRKIGARVVESQAGMDFSRPYLPGDYRIIRAGIDTRRFNPRVPPIPELRDSKPRILFVGRFDPRKGLLVLIEALPLVAERLPGVELVVVGQGQQETEARQLARRLGVLDRIQFRGRAANEMLPRYYVSADVYCAPSLCGEGFGIVLLEAMASGTPVVATNITGYNEVVKDGRNGVLCPAGDSRALADTLTRVLSDTDLRSRLKAGGLAAAQHYDWSRVAQEFENLYLELLARN